MYQEKDRKKRNDYKRKTQLFLNKLIFYILLNTKLLLIRFGNYKKKKKQKQKQKTKKNLTYDKDNLNSMALCI
jgi:hypothetical protein